MKFTDGMWKLKEGVSVDWMGNVERVNVKNEQADLLLTKPIFHGRGDKLNSVTLSSTVSSPLPGIIAAKFVHWDGQHETGPCFPVHRAASHAKIQSDSGRELRVLSDPLKLSVDAALNQLAFKYEANGKYLTGHSGRSVGLIQDSRTPSYKTLDELYVHKDHYILLELDLSVGEKIYGLGERFGPFVKNGQSVDLWNEDGGTSSELAYKNVPFYMSSRGYGIFINHPGKVMLEIQSERTTRVNIVVQGESLEYMLVAGPTPKDILRRYTALTGRPSLPPAWSYGLWLTTSFTTSYDEDTVTGFLDGLRERSIPLSVFHFDAYWMKSYSWCDFDFDADCFPNPDTYLARLKSPAYGLRTCVWLNTYVSQHSKLFAEGKQRGYFIMRADTPVPTVWQTNWWQPGMTIVDFTNPDASKWFASHLIKLMDMGVDSFKTDFGERIPFDPKTVRYHDGSDPTRMHNFYTYLYNKCVWETMEQYQRDCPDRKISPCLFARSATAGCQQFPVHWSGDCESTFPAMAETLRGGLSLALSGFAFWAHDIGGFEGLPPPALYKRWVQFGLLCSHSRLHGSSSFRVPWIYADHPELGGADEADECTRVLRESVKRKLSLMPYLLRTALDAKEHGTPILRPMLMEFGEWDETVWESGVDTQYMLGSNLLVAPVFEEDGNVRFYVPFASSPGDGNTSKATWRSWFDHSKTYESGRWYKEKHSFDTFPLLIRPEAIIPINDGIENPEDDILGADLKLLVNGPLTQVNSTDIELVNSDQVSKIFKTISIDVNGNIVHPEGEQVEVVRVDEHRT